MHLFGKTSQKGQKEICRFSFFIQIKITIDSRANKKVLYFLYVMHLLHFLSKFIHYFVFQHWSNVFPLSQRKESLNWHWNIIFKRRWEINIKDFIPSVSGGFLKKVKVGQLKFVIHVRFAFYVKTPFCLVSFFFYFKFSHVCWSSV